MPGGLFQLIAYGSQNVILSGNPDMTFFYATFKKYTHFALESVSKLMEGPTDILYDQTIQLRARVDRVGDLLSDVYFSFTLPAVFSKFQQLNFQTGPTSQAEFQWVRNVGAASIQNVQIVIGPNKVQEFTGEYLMARAKIDYEYDKYEKWRRLVGDVPELYDPATGAYGNKTATGGEYPTVYQDDTTTGAQVNTPSIPQYRVHVPIPFWFTEEGQALPLIALQYYFVDIIINLNPSRELYTTLDLSGNRMAPGYRVVSSVGDIQRNVPGLTNASDTNYQIRNFVTDVGATLPPLNNLPHNAALHFTYVYLPEQEQKIFASNPLTYITRQITLIPFQEITGNELLDLKIHNPITRLVILPRRSDSVLYRNNLTNYTNWWNYPNRPKIPTQILSNSQYIEQSSATGQLVPNGQMDIIQALRILVSGNELQEPKQIPFFTQVTPFRYLNGGADTHIPVYTFELHSPTRQPAGSINSSKVSKFQLDLQVYPLPPNSTYIYSLNIYVENLNFFIVESGMGSLKYAL